MDARVDGRAHEDVFQIAIVVRVQSANHPQFLGAQQLPGGNAVFGARARFQGQFAIGPQLMQ